MIRTGASLGSHHSACHSDLESVNSLLRGCFLTRDSHNDIFTVSTSKSEEWIIQIKGLTNRRAQPSISLPYSPLHKGDSTWSSKQVKTRTGFVCTELFHCKLVTLLEKVIPESFLRFKYFWFFVWSLILASKTSNKQTKNLGEIGYTHTHSLKRTIFQK